MAKRRANGEGNVQHRKDGRWSVTLAKFCYTYQIKLFFSVMDSGIMDTLGIIVLAGSLIAAAIAFIIAYRRNGLE